MHRYGPRCGCRYRYIRVHKYTEHIDVGKQTLTPQSHTHTQGELDARETGDTHVPSRVWMDYKD